MIGPALIGAISGEGVAGAVPWTPAALTSLYAWYKADAPGNTLSGSNIATMDDLSGNGHSLTASGASMPVVASAIGSRSIVRLASGTSNRLNMTNSRAILQNRAGFHFAMMANFTYAGSNLGHIFVGDTPTAGTGRIYVRYPHSSAGNQRPYILARRLDNEPSITILNPSTAMSGIAAALFNVDYSSTSAEIRWNGTSVASSNTFLTAGTTSNTLGAVDVSIGNQPSSNNAFGGDIGEIVVCTESLSAGDRQKLEGYLAWQWGQQGSLPVGHPYKSAPPTI